MADPDRLTLRQALDEDRLSEFIDQQSPRELDLAARAKFKAVLRAAVKPETVAHQTSGSQTADGSTDSKTPRGKAAASRG